MRSNIYGASNLQFLEQTPPTDIEEVLSVARSLIDDDLAGNGTKLSSENLSVLRSLRSDLDETTYEDFIDLDYPKFSITRQEYDWLKRHDTNNWVEYLTHRYKFKVYPTQRKLSKFPVHLLLEPTPICNLRCVMCFQIDKTFNSDKQYIGMMSWELFTSVIDQAADHGCHAITLASRGEPTLHKRFGEMLLYINDKGILDIKINTNATRLTEKLCHDILSANVATVTLSVDSTDKETYERIRVLGKFEKVLANIERFNQIRATHYPRSQTTTRVSGVGLKDTESPEEMQRFWSDYADQVSIREEIPRWDSYGNPLSHRESICKLLYERIYVWYDGICNPCDFDYKSYLAIGDATKDYIETIWHGERYQKLREAHENQRRSCVVPCDRCPF